MRSEISGSSPLCDLSLPRFQILGAGWFIGGNSEPRNNVVIKVPLQPGCQNNATSFMRRPLNRRILPQPLKDFELYYFKKSLMVFLFQLVAKYCLKNTHIPIVCSTFTIGIGFLYV